MTCELNAEPVNGLKSNTGYPGLAFPTRLQQYNKEITMGDHVYKVVELVGSSSKSIEDAIENAIGRAGKTLSNLDWFEVVDTRGHIDGGKVGHYQVTVKVGFRLKD